MTPGYGLGVGVGTAHALIMNGAGKPSRVTEWLPTVSGPKVNGLLVTFTVLPSITMLSGVPFVNVTIRLPPCALPATAHVVVKPHAGHWPPEIASQGVGDGVGATVGAGVAVGVGVGVAVGDGVTAGATVGETVGVTVDPQAARPTAAIAMLMMVVSFMSAARLTKPTQRSGGSGILAALPLELMTGATPSQREYVTNGYIRAKASNVLLRVIDELTAAAALPDRQHAAAILSAADRLRRMLDKDDTPIPPTPRERATFDAATTGTPKDFVRTCRAAGLEPRQMLDTFDAAPWRWLFSFSPEDPVTDEVRHRPLQPPVRERLDATREYVATSWWRRVFSPPAAFEATTRHAHVRRRLPGR